MTTQRKPQLEVCISDMIFLFPLRPYLLMLVPIACASLKTCYTLATYSNTNMEDAFAAGKEKTKKQDPLHWFQLYVEQDREATKQLVQRAERAGYKALVITVDRPRLGRRLADLRNTFKLPKHLTLANFAVDESRSGAGAYAGGAIDASLSWKDIEWFKSITKLPIVIKGIFRGEDAKLAAKAGVDGIIVSNHGGRQLDGCPATVSERFGSF
jgi:(S)-2-hydroxy-acid oxidase